MIIKRLFAISLFLVLWVTCFAKGFIIPFDGLIYYFEGDEHGASNARVIQYSDWEHRYSGDVVVHSEVSNASVAYPEEWHKVPVDRISNRAFSWSDVTSVTLPETINYIEMGAFSGSESLKRINIPSGVGVIEEQAFLYCKSLKNIDWGFAPSVWKIDPYAFSNCGFEHISLPNSVTTLEGYTYVDCQSLRSAVIPSSVVNCGPGIFTLCSNLTDVVLPENLIKVPDSMFDRCTSLKGVCLPDVCEEIGQNAFAGCSELASLPVSKSLRKIDEYAFYGCHAIEELTVPTSVEEIGICAFLECKGLKSITFPGHKLKLGVRAFASLPNLESVKVFNTDPTEIICEDLNWGEAGNPSNITLYMPKGLYMTYVCAPGWSNFGYYLEHGTEIRPEIYEGEAVIDWWYNALPISKLFEPLMDDTKALSITVEPINADKPAVMKLQTLNNIWSQTLLPCMRSSQACVEVDNNDQDNGDTQDYILSVDEPTTVVLPLTRDDLTQMYYGRFTMLVGENACVKKVTIVDKPSGIEDATMPSGDNGQIFDLLGRPSKATAPGLYIQDGRKYIRK